ncbi:unnamed protein product, partial [Musa acuminata var. zebrina]
ANDVVDISAAAPPATNANDCEQYEGREKREEEADEDKRRNVSAAAKRQTQHRTNEAHIPYPSPASLSRPPPNIRSKKGKKKGRKGKEAREKGEVPALLLLRLLLLLWRNSGGNRSSRPPTPMTRVTPAPAPAATDLRGRFRQCSSPFPLNPLTDGRQTGWSQATRSRAGEYEERGGAVSSSYVRTDPAVDFGPMDASFCDKILLMFKTIAKDIC